METEHEDAEEGEGGYEETDYESQHRDLESQHEDMESRRDDVAGQTQTARQDLESKVSDQNVPGAQDEQEEVIYGRDAVEGKSDEEGSEGEDGEPRREQDEDDVDSRGGGSEGSGYREE